MVNNNERVTPISARISSTTFKPARRLRRNCGINGGSSRKNLHELFVMVGLHSYTSRSVPGK